MKTCIVYHEVDLDGWMSAAIVEHWFIKNNNYREINGSISFENHVSIADCDTSLDFIGYNYGQPIPDFSKYDKVIMVDISFPDSTMQILKELCKEFIWIDHHISSIKDSEEYHYNDIKGLRNTKYAACELTWNFFFPDEPMPEIVRLLGRYDSFGHKFTKEDESRRLILLEYTKSTKRCMSQEEQNELSNLNIKLEEEQKILEFQYGARQCINNYEEAYNYLIRSKNDRLYESGQYFDNILDQIYDKGKAIYQYLCTEAKQVYKNGFKILFIEEGIEKTKTLGTLQCFDKRTFFCINKERFNPINFGINYHKDGYDGCASFYFDGKQYNFSLYNDNGKVDCSVIAKYYGGGGHKGAAGFRLNKDEFNKLLLS